MQTLKLMSRIVGNAVGHIHNCSNYKRVILWSIPLHIQLSAVNAVFGEQKDSQKKALKTAERYQRGY